MGAQGRVLVVDDEPVVREVLTRYLERDGFDVETAADGEDAIAAHRVGQRRGNSVRLPRPDFRAVLRGDAARSSEGAGLGPALSKRIVESLGGEIEVDSDPD